MSAVELILTALAAGTGAGVKDTATAAVQDAYAELRNLLRRRIAAGQRASAGAGANEVEAVGDIARDQLISSGAVEDEAVLSAAIRMLEVADPGGVVEGKYAHLGLPDPGGAGRRAGDVRITTSYGPVAGTMTGPVTVSYGERPPIPPGPPES